MVIPIEILNKWKELRSDGDLKQLGENNPNISRETFRLAFVQGKCGDAVFKSLSEFYKDKVDMIVEVKNTLNEL